MNILKTTLTLFILLVHITGFSQSNVYDFVPAEFIPLSDEQVMQMSINIRPGILLFNDKGDALGMDKLSLMTNAEFRPIFYSDTEGKIRAIVFENKAEHPILVEKNPEAEFTEGEYALDFLTQDMNGNSIKLSDLRGKIVVLNFWFIKCKPCIMEMPDLNQVVNKYDSNDVVFLGITFDSEALVKQFLQSTAFNYTIAANANDVINIYGIQSFPTNMVINQQGQIVLKEIGYRTNMKDVLISAINKLL